MANQHNVFRFELSSDSDERLLGVAHRIQTRAIPSATAVLDASHVDVGTQPAAQRAGDEHHPDIGQLPPPGSLVAAHLAARQDQHTRTGFHSFYSEPPSTRSQIASLVGL